MRRKVIEEEIRGRVARGRGECSVVVPIEYQEIFQSGERKGHMGFGNNIKLKVNRSLIKTR